MGSLATGSVSVLALQKAKQSSRYVEMQTAVSAGVTIVRNSKFGINLPRLTANGLSPSTSLRMSRRRRSPAVYSKDKEDKVEREDTTEPPASDDNQDADDKNDEEQKSFDAGDEEEGHQNEEHGEEIVADHDNHQRDDLKKSLANAVYGTNWGMNATRETHAAIADIITQLEAVNPTPAPTENLETINGKWIMAYTSVEEFLPFIAAKYLPLVNITEIAQDIDADSLTIDNTVSFTGPYMKTTFTKCASFDVRSPKRLQMMYEESFIATSQVDEEVVDNGPEMTDFMGHKINLRGLKSLLQPIEDVTKQVTKQAASHPPLRIPYPANTVQSWQVITYVDDCVRIARVAGGGVFALVKPGSAIAELLASTTPPHL
ncbi:probable plastid-lipid-associated protein 2, chloroplastic isoform X2 [Physcomitrium patens]|uniref:Plastid lipid-associated protein/fibrillin conserved domain-containing protein n=1 Tax=Physcomitrium patens TaxID=3218 RepID=A0A2K1IVF7_PHYPA|nr:plastid lipid-associated protein 2, chloroplastic-like isoform X2 [Physcomitrium patens]PNR33263.1 hypothetical protein PHYPA_025206 [Physcomitrium patens]|eukprot:XP_024357347.1 plastid lipid-associated protein 2, chloroplastic-like isoform X2 [Physcomitrella patens]